MAYNKPLIAVIVLGLLAVSLFALWQFSAREGAQRPDYVAVMGAPEDQVIAWARKEAQARGLTGAAEHESWALMTLGTYETLSGSPVTDSLPRDTPVFVYQVFGDFPEYNLLGGGTESAVGYTTAYHAVSGQPLANTTYPTRDQLQFAVDLSRIPADSGPLRTDPRLIPTPFAFGGA